MDEMEPTSGGVTPVGSTTPVWDSVTHAATRQEKMAAATNALALVTLPDLNKPVPKMFVDLPWRTDREAAQEAILARLIAADDLEKATHDDALVKLEDAVGHKVTIHGCAAVPGDIEEGWGAYLSLDVTIDDGDEHKVINTGSREVTVVAWRAHCENRFPLSGQVILKGNPTPGRNQPVGFVVESAL